MAQGLADMPSVERVQAEIKGSDPVDTLARQVAVFNVLVQYVNRIKTSRSVRGPFTPDEQKLFDAYRLAAYQISQQFAKTHTAAETQAFNGLHNRYEMDGAFEHDWRARLLGSQASATYNAAMTDLSAGQQKHYQQEMDQYKQAVAQQQAAKNRQASGGSNDPNDPTGVAIRRCLELGGSSISCLGKGINTGMFSLVGLGGMESITSQITGPGPARVVLHGTYARPGEKTSLEFSIGKVSIAGCGDLDASQTAPTYAIEKRPGSARIVVNNSPAPFTLALGPNGGLTGPGMVDVTGKVIVGWTTQTTQVYHNGVSVGAGYAAECGGSCRNTTQSPIYKVKTERCTIGTYNAPPPLPPPNPKADALNNSPVGMIGGLVAYTNGGAEAMDNADAPRGLRMNGLYSDGRMRLQFSPAAAILDCGEAHVRLEYTVENTPDRFLVHVANSSGGPFTLAVEPDNSLRGSGQTTVNGRLISGMEGENVTYRPHSETCEVGTLRPDTGSGETMKVAEGSAAAPPADSTSVAPASYTGPEAPISAVPAPSAATSAAANRAYPATASATGAAGTGAAMRVFITSAFDGGANPMAGQVVWVMRERMDAVLRSLGAPIPANATPSQAWIAFAMACKGRDCSSALAQLKTRVVAATRLDAGGKATISTQTAATGTYYLFAQVRGPGGLLMWDVPANFQPGDNTVTLTATNAELIH
ncbi:hypothetical protein [Edaphobacter acidisoli]|uniref:hypothetical protein n=1 Tax=Edaphobacter acidisoli TaxID=2040573 RepID=UPI00166DAB09|nr:hypothetical protein [Edaphobacter acidisoli]